jgi:hypothetical protein
MPDNEQIEFESQQSRISDDGLAFYRQQLNDPTFQRDFPERYAALKASVDIALNATGQKLEQTGEPQTAAPLHDARWGVSLGQDGRVALPEHLSAGIERDAAGEAPDPATVKEQLAAIGLDPTKTIAAATALLQQTGSKVDPSRLTAFSIAQLSVFGSHLARAKQTRPR